MSEIDVGSVWVDKTNDKIIATVSRLMPENQALQYKTNIGWTTSSVSWFLADFKPMKVEQDMVNHPPHYNDESGIECIEVTKHMGFLGGNCFKYLYRAGKKGSTIEDLKKAAWYAERAWIMNEIVPIAARRNIREVLRYRDGNICKAMQMIKVDNWNKAEVFIRAEIERLQSEGDK